MGRLTQVRSRLVPAGTRLPRLDPRVEYEKRRAATLEWRAWYKTARWQKLAWKVKVRDAFTCQMCGFMSAAKFALSVDHRQPHRGDEVLFWDEGNLQTLCKPCHDGEKQRQERGARR
jgi:5-methylcytosine-specific restriction enzyme A